MKTKIEIDIKIIILIVVLLTIGVNLAYFGYNTSKKLNQMYNKNFNNLQEQMSLTYKIGTNTGIKAGLQESLKRLITQLNQTGEVRINSQQGTIILVPKVKNNQ